MEHDVDTRRPVAPATPRKGVSLPSACRRRYHYKDGHLFVDDEKMPARPDAL